MAKAITPLDAPKNVKAIYPQQDSQRQTRQTDTIQLTMPKFKTTKLQQTSSYQIPYLWNQLHQSAKELSMRSISNFVRNQLTEMYNMEYYAILFY